VNKRRQNDKTPPYSNSVEHSCMYVQAL